MYFSYGREVKIIFVIIKEAFLGVSDKNLFELINQISTMADFSLNLNWSIFTDKNF